MMSEPLRLELHLLGRFSAGVEARPGHAIRLASRKSRALLAYLAMQPQFLETRERLADLLWGNRGDKQARQSLRQCLASLRKDIEPAIADLLVLDHDTVALAAGRLNVDAREFLRLAESSEAADLERAVDLYAGAFLDKLDLDDEPFSDWVRSERARLAASAAQLLERCAEQADQAGHGPQAIKAAERLVALDPLHEPAQRLLLRLLAQYRGRAAAASQTDIVQALLRDELGVAPEPETRALIGEIRGAAQSSAMTAHAGAALRRMDEEPSSASLQRVPSPAAETLSAASLVAPAVRPPAKLVLAAVVSGVLVVGLGVFMVGQRESLTSVPVAAQVGTGGSINVAQQAWRSPAVPGVTADQPWLAAQGQYAVLVLPFTVESEERPDERLLADRLSDDLISDLSRVPAIRVISRQTSRLYRGRTVDPGAVGAELGVRYVVEGHVRLEGTGVTVNVALTDTGSRLQVWSDRVVRDSADPADLQDDLTRGLARRLQINVVGTEEGRRLPQVDAAGADVRDLLAKGWGAVVRSTRADLTGGAEGYFEEVLRRQPGNVSGMTGLAASYVQAAVMFLLPDPEPRLTQAEALLTRALAASPRMSLAHFYLGMLEKTRGRPQAALGSFMKVLELNPSYAPAYAQVGHVLSRIGRLNEAMEHVRYAIRLSPKDHAAGIWTLFGGQIELELGHDDAALDWLARAVELTPRNPFAQASLAAAYALRGDHASAGKHAAEVRKLAPTLTLERMRERLVGLSDNGGEPHRLLEGLRLAFAKPS
jgi:DNA-binding SARP family transcriptional activator/TolB-like protein/Tfp pilus assembly protein PilF